MVVKLLGKVTDVKPQEPKAPLPMISSFESMLRQSQHPVLSTNFLPAASPHTARASTLTTCFHFQLSTFHFQLSIFNFQLSMKISTVTRHFLP